MIILDTLNDSSRIKTVHLLRKRMRIAIVTISSVSSSWY